MSVLLQIRDASKRYGDQILLQDAECTITSANDSKHSEKSLHYNGCALDFRTKDYAGDKQALRDRIKAALGPDFDVVLEALGEDNEHIHVEYDPK